MRVVPVVLSGGSGTRLWPLSTPGHPKQLHALVGDEPMLVETIRRLEGLEVEDPVVVCGAGHAEGVREVLAGIPATVVVEPAGRNTAPAIAVAARRCQPDDVLLVLPSDHVIADTKAFHSAVAEAVALARSGSLVTFGIVATKAATGYGWIEPGEPVGGARRVASFKEKPDGPAAEAYLAAGWLWNSGMFCFEAGAYLDELEAHRPDVAGAVSADLAAYEAVPSVSVDHAVMEPTDRAVVVPLDAGWSDVGSWASLWEVLPKDDSGNAVRGPVHLHDSVRTLAVAEGEPVAVIGQSDVAVVAGPEGVVVVPLGRAEDVRKATESIRSGR